MESEKDTIAMAAARLVVEEGLDFGAAKRRALHDLGWHPRTALPNNSQLEIAVEDYIAIFCPEEQQQALLALRALAVRWMRRLAVFEPYISGAVWHGSATHHSDIYLQLFCEDAKATEIALIDLGIVFEPRRVIGLHGEAVEALSIHAWSEELAEDVGLHLLMYDRDDIRGALKPDARGRKPRGNLAALQSLLPTLCAQPPPHHSAPNPPLTSGVAPYDKPSRTD